MTSMKTKLWREILRRVQKNSDKPVIGRMANIAFSLYRAAHNPSYDFATNGELRALRIVVGAATEATVLDVGANVGHWSCAAAALSGTRSVHAFEPSAATYAKLLANTSGIASITAFNFGLSSETRKLELAFSAGNPEKSSVEMTGVQGFNRQIKDYRSETQAFVKGDEFCAEHGIGEIAFLKIDTEGHDYLVLEGFAGMLREGRIRAVQFEYNRLNIYARRLLHDFYQLLNPNSAPDSFAIGRIFPASVRFKAYNPLDENFIDGNFLAVHRSQSALIDLLKRP